MRISTIIPQDDLRKVRTAIRSAEAEGYAIAVTNENKHDPFLPLAVAAVIMISHFASNLAWQVTSS